VLVGPPTPHCKPKTGIANSHMAPLFNLPSNNVHPLKLHGMGSAINMGMADGSVVTLNSNISSENFYFSETPQGGDMSSDPQIP